MAGRPKIYEDMQRLHIRLERKTVEKIKKESAKTGKSVNRIIMEKIKKVI